MRLDKFLKVSRILKRRAAANAACGADRVFVNGQAAKPSRRLKVGDEVKILFGGGEMNFTVKALNEKAGKDEADTLYEIVN